MSISLAHAHVVCVMDSTTMTTCVHVRVMFTYFFNNSESWIIRQWNEPFWSLRTRSLSLCDIPSASFQQGQREPTHQQPYCLHSRWMKVVYLQTSKRVRRYASKNTKRVIMLRPSKQNKTRKASRFTWKQGRISLELLLQDGVLGLVFCSHFQ